MASKDSRKFSGLKTEKELNKIFYKRFEENYWINKADALITVIDFFDEIKEIVGDGWKYESPKEKILVNLRAEIYFTSFHMAEATFALLFAPFQAVPHWIYMTTYKDMRKRIRDYLNNDFSDLTSEKCSTKEELIELCVYSGFIPESEEEKDSWNRDIANIIWMLDRIGSKYIGATGFEKGEYNSYKHGLRVETNIQSLSFHEDGHPEREIMVAPPNNSVSYLQFTKAEINEEKKEKLSEVTKQFSYVEAYAYIVFMTRLLKQIKDTRIAKLDGKIPEFKGTFNLDRGEILNISAYAEWEFTF